MHKRAIAASIAVAALGVTASAAQADPGQLYFQNTSTLAPVSTAVTATATAGVDFGSAAGAPDCTSATINATVEDGPAPKRDTLKASAVTFSGCTSGLKIISNSGDYPWTLQVTNETSSGSGLWNVTTSVPQLMMLAIDCGSGEFVDGEFDVYSGPTALNGVRVRNVAAASGYGSQIEATDVADFTKQTSNCSLPSTLQLSGTFRLSGVTTTSNLWVQ